MSISSDGIAYAYPGTLPQHAGHSFQFLLVRLLLGKATLLKNGLSVFQETDYSVLPPTAQIKTSAAAFKEFLSSSGTGTNAQFIQATRPDNRQFYRDLLAEFGNFFLQSKKNSHCAAFVFLYRILERLSYTVPLLYCSVQSDYMGTFKDLKTVFSDVEGELGLFKKFLLQGKFIDPLKLDIGYTINFFSAYGNEASFYRLTTKRFVNFANVDPSIHQVEIKFRDVPDLLKVLRNRFFHSRTGDGQLNVTIQEMIDPDEYFASVNPVFCSFLAIVVLQTVIHKYQRK